MRIAVIGAGISGLTAAYCLADEHELTLFEAASHIGGHTLTSRVEGPDGRSYQVDAGFIVFNEVNYPNLVRLFERLGVESQPTSMSFSVQCGRTGLEYGGTSWNSLFAQRRNLLSVPFVRMLFEIARFNREGRGLLRSGELPPRLGEMLQDGGYSSDFVQRYLVPLGAAIWSSSPEKMLEFPASLFLRFLDNHGLLSVDGHHQWRSVVGGSNRYVEPLTRPFADRIWLETPVRSVRRERTAVRVETATGIVERFDHVVLATHSDQALRLLGDPDPEESEVLGAIGYQVNEAVMHTDTSLLPRSRRAWASWNYHVPREPLDRVRVTYDMKRLQCLEASAPRFCVSLNPGGRVASGSALRSFRFAHPCFTPAAEVAKSRWARISGVRRTHYCGAYWGNGFHEDGVNSGLAVARALGAQPEWAVDA